MATYEASLSEDLGILAAEDRNRLGEPPTAEQLIALRDGKLPEEEAERLRDRLAVDPEWTSIYLELKRPLNPGDAEEAGEVDLDEAWDRLSRKMEIPSIQDHKRNLVEPGVVSAREVIRRFLPLAAGLLLGLGLLWSITHGMSGEFYPVVVTGEDMRSHSMVEMPGDSAGLMLQIAISPFDQPTDVVVKFTDFKGVVVHHQRSTLAAGQERLEFRVPAAVLQDGWTYELTLALLEPDRPPLIEQTFELGIE